MEMGWSPHAVAADLCNEGLSAEQRRSIRRVMNRAGVGDWQQVRGGCCPAVAVAVAVAVGASPVAAVSRPNVNLSVRSDS